MIRKTFTLAAIVTAAVLLLGGVASATVTSGTATVTQTNEAGYQVIRVAWTSTAGGAVLTDDIYINGGEIVQIETDPRTPAPTDNYDIRLLNQQGTDISLGLLQNRDTANTETVHYGTALSTTFSTSTLTQAVNTLNNFVPWIVHVQGRLTLEITNAGDAKQGTIRILVKRGDSR